MTDQELQQLIERISNESFQVPFRHTASFNSRLRSTGGRYMLETHNIEINPQIATDYPPEILVGVIKHELCHYHLHLNHRGYQHRDHDFKVLLQKVGGSRYSPSSLRSDPQIVYECRQCHKRYYRQRHFNVQKYRCSRCGGHLKLISK